MIWKTNAQRTLLWCLYTLGTPCILGSGCGYSFSGASFSSSAQTFSIAQFYNHAQLGPPDIAAVFSDKLRNYFERQSPLTLVEKDGDAHFEGIVEDYTLSPIAAQAPAGQQDIGFASLTRLSITVSVSYMPKWDEKEGFVNEKFSFFIDFDHTKVDLVLEEEALIESIFDQIVQDIFNRAFANW